MSGKIMWGRFLTVSTLLMVGGYALLTMTTPTEEQFYNSLSPELKRKVDEVRRVREGHQGVKDALQSASEDGKVVWASDLKAAQDAARK